MNFNKQAYFLAATILLTAGCGTTRKAVSPTVAPEAPVILPLEDPLEIERSRQRAQEVMDSIDRVRKAGEKPEENAPKEAPRQQAPAQEVTEPEPVSLPDQVIAYARTFLGTPYKLGASGPSKFDCSGFTRYVFKKFGYNLTQYSGAQLREGREVAGYRDLQKGDLVFFGKRGSVRNIGHVGIVVSIDEETGDFTFIHASVSNGVVEQTSSHPYFMMRYIGARRVLPDEPR